MSAPLVCWTGDPTCPCPDGDLCHYRGPDPWRHVYAGPYARSAAAFLGTDHERALAVLKAHAA